MITQISPEVKAIHFQNFGSIVYLIQLSHQNILIDTSSKENANELLASIQSINIPPNQINTIILTHAHYDHTENINLFPNAKIYGNFTKQINPDHTQTKIPSILPIENLTTKELTIHKTPGHTQGDILIQYKNILFSGDIIFHNGYIGRTDFPESDEQKMQQSLDFIKTLKFKTLCPGH